MTAGQATRPAPAIAAPMDIVCFGGMEWDHVLWTNRQHIMSRLPLLGDDVRVLYVAPPRFFLTSRIQAPRLTPRAGAGGVLRGAGERLWVLQPVLPVPNRTLSRVHRGSLERWTAATTRRALRRLRFERPVVWSYTPLIADWVQRLEPRALCYDVVDDYAALPGQHLPASTLEELDRTLTASADLVFTTSQVLQDEHAPLNLRCVLVGNAADVEAFALARSGRFERPNDLPAAGPIALFHGAVVEHKLDVALLVELAGCRPDWTFALVGPCPDGDTAARLRACPNVSVLGLRPSAQLPAYLQHADACLIPYRRTRYTQRLNALKLYECLAAGRPVVTSDLPCFEPWGDNVRRARNPQEWSAALDEVAAGRAPQPVPLEDLAGFSWEAKARRQLAELRRTLARKETLVA